MQPLDLDQANRELVRRFGVVVPFVSSASLRAIPVGSLTADLLAPLTPVRRRALRAHLNATELLDADQLDIDAVRQRAHALRALIDAVGPDGTDHDVTSGWLPASVVDTVVAGVEWDADAAADLLSSFARRAGLIRRLRGRVVVTALGKQLMADPVKGFPRVVSAIPAKPIACSASSPTDCSRCRLPVPSAWSRLTSGGGAAASQQGGGLWCGGLRRAAREARDSRVIEQKFDKALTRVSNTSTINACRSSRR